MIDDAHLLRAYCDARSESAFAELVQRHITLVYQAAVRQLGEEAHLASDVAQNVFLLLARRANGLDVTLPPGSYSVQLASGDTTSGVELIEVYDVPPGRY